ncbi:MAG: DUF167 family protein [Elusimicrobiaceae bacterium]|nr:DUF167 family protein [Elusimicrobiaceae bacterium]
MPRYIKLRVHPGSKKARVLRKAEDTLEIWVKAPAERGLATAEALAAAAEELGVERRLVRLIKGAQSPSKTIELLA